MGDRSSKDALFDGFAEVAKALASGRRAEIVDLLSQGERSVEEVAAEIGQSVANTSHHLRALLRGGLLVTRREGTRIYYSLASDRVGSLWTALRDVAASAPPDYLVERLVLDVNGHVERLLTHNGSAVVGQRLAEARRRLAEHGCRVPAAEARIRYADIGRLLDGVLTRCDHRRATVSDRIDHVLTHRAAGLAVFALLFGLCYGGLVALNPALAADYFGGRNAGGIIGVLYSGVAIGALLGTAV